MAVKNAQEASLVVRNFLTQMGVTPLLTPVCAERKGDVWIVQVKVGFTPMQFEIDALTGEILRYCECR